MLGVGVGGGLKTKDNISEKWKLKLAQTCPRQFYIQEPEVENKPAGFQ